MATGSSSAQAGVLVRRAEAGDLERVWPLLEQYYSEWDIWQRDGREKVLADLRQPAPFGFILAELGGTPAGCVLVRALGIPHAAECKRLFVPAAYRGHGIASLLMDFAESLAVTHDVREMYLDSKPEFAAALALYRRRGYEPCERYNQNAQATLFFRKRLSSGAV